MRTVIGFDIGKRGGWVFRKEEEVLLYETKDVDFWVFLLQLKTEAPVIVYAEDVHAFGGQGAVSTGTLMEAKGYLRGAVEASDAQIRFIQPISWIQCFTLRRQKHFLTTKGEKDKKAWKTHLMEVGKEAAITYKLPLVNEITLDTADAFLIWLYGYFEERNIPLQPLKPPPLKFK